jgi:exonuclease SbcC
MSKIISIAAKNVKGLEIDEKLTGREIYLGPNGCGKSARLEAMIYGLHGCLPWLGKTEGSTFQLASDEFMVVNLACDDGFFFGRTIRRRVTNKRDGTKTYSYKTQLSVFPDEGERNDSEKIDRILKKVGDFPVMFDLNEFLSMSNEKKRGFIFSLSSPESHGWTQERVFEHLLGHGVDCNKSLNSEDRTVTSLWKDAKSITENMSLVASVINALMRDAKAIKKDKDAAKVEIIRMRQEITEDATQNVTEIDEKLDELFKQRQKIHEGVVRAEESRKSHSQLVARLEEVRGAKANLDSPTAVEDLEKQVLALQDEIEELDKKREESATRVKALHAEDKNLEAKKAACDRMLILVDRRAQIQELIDTIDKVGCPFLKEQCETDLTEYKKVLEKQWEDNDREIKEKYRPERDAIIVEIGKLQTKFTNERNTEKELKKKIAEFARNLKVQRTQHTDLVRANDALKAKSESLDREEASANKMLRESTPGSDVTVQKRTIEGYDHQITKLKEERKKAESVRSVMMNFENANVAAAEAEERVDDLTKVAHAFSPGGVQSIIMEDVIGPVTKTINELLKFIPSEDGTEYQVKINLFDMNGKETFEIVRPIGDHEIPYHSLSGGQQILFGTALVVALVLLANPNTKVLCIEAAELDSDNFFRLLTALQNIGKDIDNILIASCNDEVTRKLTTRGVSEDSEVMTDIGTWNVVQLGV